MSDPVILAHQPLDQSGVPHVLVTITTWGTDGDSGREEKTVTRFVMPDGTRTRNWLEGLKDYAVSVVCVPIPIKSEPKVVHAVIPFETSQDTTACGLATRRWRDYHQSLDQAFHRVLERPDCKACQTAVQHTTWKDAWFKGELQGAVLRQWSWDNVDEEYRPGGPKHRYARNPA
jgi:hypothetical protein